MQDLNCASNNVPIELIDAFLEQKSLHEKPV